MTMHPQKKILIYRTGQLGDTLVAMPAIYNIREAFPEYDMILLTDSHPVRKSLVSSWDILEPTGWFKNVIFYVPAKGLWDTLITMYELANQLRSLAPEIIFNLAPKRTDWQTFRDKLFFKKMMGIPQYVGPGKAINSNNPQRAMVRIEPEWRRLLNLVNTGNDVSKFVMPIPITEEENVNKIFTESHIENNADLLAVSPGSNRSTTKWPTERFAELGKRLLMRYPSLHIMVLGGNEDKKIGDELCKEWSGKGYNFAGQLTVYGSAAALRRCSAFVGNDTGTMHLAAMNGKPCVALFSARNYPGEWEPYGNNHIILRHDTECAGCRLDECHQLANKCLRKITVDEAFQAVSSVLRKTMPKVSI